MKSLLLLIVLFCCASLDAQIIKIAGFAPSYVGKSVEIYTIDDYFSMKESLLARAEVKSDSTFRLITEISKTQKIIIKSNNNEGFMYVQPGGDYEIFFPDRDKYDPYRPNGNSVEVAFYDLDSTDINYKILGFERWVDHFVGNNFYIKNADPQKFSESMDRFKTNVEKAYKDDTSTFLKTFVRFRIASLDNIQTAAERNRYEKHDFYIKYSPVSYENDAYMSYIKDFYQNLMPRLSNEANQAVYEGVLQSSPSVIMRALGSEYTLINMRIREMIMVNALAEVYHSGDFPQTNIITILDSVSTNSLFDANAVIATNLKRRLTDLVPGVKAPSFFLSYADGTAKTLANFEGGHLYLHFFQPNSLENRKELGLLKEMHKRYSEQIQFVTIYQQTDTLSTEGKKAIESITWDAVGISDDNTIWKNYQVKSFPHYVLIDALGNIVMSPALGPTPNGEYQTIDLTFFDIQKVWLEQNKE